MNTLSDIIFNGGKIDNRGITFIQGENKEEYIPYSKLYEDARFLLGSLNQKGIKNGDELVFQIEENKYLILLFWACILGGITPVPITVGKNSEHRIKLLKIWQILKSPYLVSDLDIVRGLEDMGDSDYIGVIENIKLRAFNFNELNEKPSSGEIFNAKPEDIAFIQFSSGSTGEPKGIILTHENLAFNIAAINKGWETTSSDSSLSWMPLTHDMGMIAVHLTCLAAGINQYLLPTSLFVRQPTLWIKKANEHKITQLYSPNFGYKHFLTFFNKEIALDWDLSHIRFIGNGAEPISAELCDSFLNELKEFGLKYESMSTVYGLAEASVGVSIPKVGSNFERVYLDRNHIGIGKRINHVEAESNDCVTFVNVGYPLNDCYVRICDENNRVLEDETVGYIQISGKNVTKGYYNNEAATSNIITPDGWLITGDLGYMKNGTIVITGRAKDIIFVNGQNYYPHDIERVAECVEGVELGKVVACGVFDKECQKEIIILFILFKKNIREFLPVSQNLKKYISEKMGLEIKHVIPVKKIPKTTSGKVQRYKFIEEYNTGCFNTILFEIEKLMREMSQERIIESPTNSCEEKLAALLMNVMKFEKVGINENLLELGLESISMMQVIEGINREFGVEITYTCLFENRTIARLAAVILSKDAKPDITPFIRENMNPDDVYEPFTLTEIQKAYLIGRSGEFELGGISTHFYLEIETCLDITCLNSALQKMIRRHPMLRTVILSDGRQQVLRDTPPYNIEVRDIRHMSLDEKAKVISNERERMAQYIFKSDSWPLFEFVAFRLDDIKSCLCMGFDMLICDGASIQIFVRELIEFYKNPDMELPDIQFTFRDYINAYEDFKAAGIYAADREYWMEKLDSFPESPAIPLKTNPGIVKNPHFKRMQKTFDRKYWEKLRNCARKNGITPSVLICTAYSYVLAFWSGQSRIGLNLAAFNRYPFHKDVEKILGDFTSVIPLSIRMNEGRSFYERARDIQASMLEALEHRTFDGVEFIREISKNNKLGVKAVLPVVFTSMLFDYAQDSWEVLGELKMGISQTSQVYLDNQIIEMNGCLSVTWDYVDELFDKDIIETMFGQYIDILERLHDGIEPKLEISREDLQIINEYNSTSEYIPESTLHGLFREQAAKKPENIAIISDLMNFTYKELDEISDKIASSLMETGVGRNCLVGVLAERNPYSIANIMGILKAGAAYVPIDPAYPEERRNYILSSSDCNILLEPGFHANEVIKRNSDGKFEWNEYPDDVAYVIYTSGSTGKPKGVVITHKAAANTVIDINRKFGVNEKDRLIGLSSMCFDLSVYDIFGALSTGAALVMVPDQRDVNNVADIINRHRVTIWNSVPAVMGMLVEALGTVPNKNEGYITKGRDILKEESPLTGREQKYFWSPSAHWRKVDGRIYIGDYKCSTIAGGIFPDFYMFTQKGVSISEILSEFPEINPDILREFVLNLERNKILTSSILSPKEVFSGQAGLFRNEYKEEIIYVEEEYEKFKNIQLNRYSNVNGHHDIKLSENVMSPDIISRRKSYREFDRNTEIDFEVFSQLISVFRQNRHNGVIRYNYASAGGLYPIDIYIYIKDSRIKDIGKGLYLYNPLYNSLVQINQDVVISSEVHYLTNKSIFEASAFSAFFVYRADVTMPKYGAMGYFYACIDCGIMVSTLTQMAEMLEIGLCSIGDMNFEETVRVFGLKENQVIIHAVEAGLKPDRKANPVPVPVPLNSNDRNDFNNHILCSHVEVACASESKCCSERVNKSYGGIDAGKHSSLRLIMLSGDWIPVRLPERIRESFEEASIISLGGATEASIWSIYYPIEKVSEEWTSIPYGIPLSNQSFYVLNKELRLCPVGIPGELYIGGAGLAKGYYKDELKTSESFICHPELGNLYRTGDFGVLRKEGYIEFLGRKDQQVKIRGYRVELGEIENCITEFGSIRNAAVCVIDEDGKKNLCGYFVADSGVDTGLLKEHVSKYLPEYMIPAYFMQLDEIPLNTNGKVDKKVLPKPVINSVLSDEESEAGDEIEENLMRIWKSVLNVEKVGMNDNFMDYGGNSLLMAKAYNRIEEIYPGKVSIVNLFAYPTLSKLSEFIRGKLDISVSSVVFPESYFNPIPGINGDEFIKFEITGEMYSDIKVLSECVNAEVSDIMLSVFIQIIYIITKNKRFTVQAILGKANTIVPVEVDYLGIKDFSDIFKIVGDKRNGKGSHDSYSVKNLGKVQFDRSNFSVVPLFYKKSLLSENVKLKDTFEIVFEMSEHVEGISFICEYANNRLDNQKVKQFVNYYIKVLQTLLDKAVD